MKTTRRLMELFRGLDRAYGQYKLTGERSDVGKAEGVAETVRGEITEELWQQHIDGVVGLGIIPITDNANCWFAVIDIDRYDLDIKKVEEVVRQHGLPFVVVRSKSGGVHLYVFFSSPIMAKDARAKLREFFSVWRLEKGTEIFPKQEEITDIGNWINMPYFDGDRTTRYAMHEGKSLSLADFLDFAESCRVSPEEFLALSVPRSGTPEPPPDGKTDDKMLGAPPCLRTLFRSPVKQGERNQAIFNYGIYLRKRYGANVLKERLTDWSKMLSPVPSAREINTAITSASSKNYQYTCDLEPIRSLCMKDLCKQCAFGVGATVQEFTQDLIIEGVQKILTGERPMWMVTVNGRQIQFDNSSDLINQARFRERVVDKLSFWPPAMPGGRWRSYINDLIQNAEEIEVPIDATHEGQLKLVLEHFCTVRAQAREKDEIRLGKAYPNGELIWFQSQHLLTYLGQQQGMKMWTAPRLWRFLEGIGGQRDTWRIKGKVFDVWGVPSTLFTVQEEDYDVPRSEEAPEF